jgi:hypothetical protein
MASGNKVAQDSEHNAYGLANTQEANAAGINSTLTPELTAMATHPAGFAPSDLAAMDTAAQQSAGGSTAGAVGQGALLASRTRNAGTADAAIADSTRRAGENLGSEAVNTRVKDALLKNEQQQGGLHGLEGLYGTDVESAVNGLNAVAKNADANSQAENSALGGQLLKQTLGNLSYSKGGGLGFGG